MRIATYNVEWFTSLFDKENKLAPDDEWSGRHDVTRAQQIEALGIVFTAMNADAIMVIEAPDGSRRRSTIEALEHFADVFSLRARKCVLGFQNHTEQEIALLFDPDVIEAQHDPKGNASTTGAPRFDTAFRWDLDVDSAGDPVRFSKPPLEIAASTVGGKAFRMIGVHVKSKAPHGARSPDQVMRIAIENRRKQLAQCIWLRSRVEEHLQQDDDIIVLGDLNDGPGLDEYEKLFGKSGVEIVMGEGEEDRLFDPHAQMLLARKTGARPSSARFYMDDAGCYMQALLDYVLISPALMSRRPAWRIWHPLDDPGCHRVPELRDALLLASDHFPVTLDIDL